MNKFQYIQAQSVADALSRLGDDFNSAKIWAGGLDLIGEMKEYLIEPQTVVSISRLAELKGIQDTGGSIKIGAVTTLSDIAHHETVRRQYTALAQAAASVGSPQIRHVGTLGGNLCQRPRCWYYRDEQIHCLKKGGSTCYSLTGRNAYHAILGGGPCFIVHPSDCAPALIALGAKITIQGVDGARQIPLEEFFILPQANVQRENILKSRELVTEIEIPATQAKSTYIKFREREGFDWALSSVAAALEFQDSVCAKASVVLGGVAPIPWRAKKAEAFLVGKEITGDAARQAGELAVDGAFALPDNAEKVDITKAIVQAAVFSLKPGSTAVETPLVY